MNESKLTSDEKVVNLVEAEDVCISQAKGVIRRKMILLPENMNKLRDTLKDRKAFNYARRVLAIASTNYSSSS